MSTGLQEENRWLVSFLYDALRCAAAKTFVELRQAGRDLAIGLLEYTYERLLLSEGVERP